MHSAIFSGRVKHYRKSPVAHAFDYRVYMMYLDLDELEEIFAGRWFWSVRRPAPVRFKRENYFGKTTEPISDEIRDLVARRTGVRPSGPVRMLTNLACFGFCFNPLTLYYCFDKQGEVVTAIVAEVSNTPWGEKHCYVIGGERNTGSTIAIRAECRKALHVSPFMGMDVDYEWLVTRPGKDLVVRIRNYSRGASFFLATLIMKRKEVTGATLAGMLCKFPVMTLSVVAGIYWQAARLWLKGCPPTSHPDSMSSARPNR